ncbi:MAG: hypothetical protein ACRDOU_32520 [Streptosporangiaceae bacterium]
MPERGGPVLAVPPGAPRCPQNLACWPVNRARRAGGPAGAAAGALAGVAGQHPLALVDDG